MRWLALLAVLWASACQAQTVINPTILPTVSVAMDDFAQTGMAPVNAFSLRRIYSTYTGFAVRLQRASDSAQKDFGFVSTALNSGVDTTAIASWCASTTCTVTVWYDQSPSGNHALPAYSDSPTPGNPIFVLNCNGALPCISFTATQGLMANSPVNGNSYQTTMAVMSSAAARPNALINWLFCCGQAQIQAWTGDVYYSSNFANYNGQGSQRAYSIANVWQSHAASYNATEMNQLTSGANLVRRTGTTSAINYPYRSQVTIGYQLFTGTYYTGYLSELVIGNTPLTVSQMQLFQSDQDTYWNVTPFPSFNFYTPTLSQSTSAANSMPWAGVNEGGIGFGGGFDSVPVAQMQPYYASRGMNVIRFPVAWEQMQQNLCTGDTTLNAAELAILDTFITQANSAGLDVLIDLHNFGGYVYTYNGRTCASPPDNGHMDQTTTQSYYVNFWTQIATRYKSNPKVMFDLMNEPAAVTLAGSVTAEQAAITAIRGTGATQYIFFEGGGTYAQCSDVSANSGAAFLTLTDSQSKLILECHAYFDSDGSGTHDEGTQGTASSRMTSATTYASAHSIKLFLGETGLSFTNSMYAEMKVAMDLMAANPSVWVGWTAWGGGPNWGDAYFYIMEPQSANVLVDRPTMRFLNTYATGHTWPTGGGGWPLTAQFP